MNIQDNVKQTLEVCDTIEIVKAPPFFKDKTMQRLFAEKVEVISVWNWFTPQLQLATLVCVVVLNVFAFSQLKEDTYSNAVNEFAETYGLSDDTELSNLIN